MALDRDFVGYGKNPPSFEWPGNNKLALSLVFNYEEGAEHSVVTDGIVETIGEFAPPNKDVRDMGMESFYEYAQRVGIWRILKLLKESNLKATFYASALALKANPEATKAIIDGGHEICDHGYGWRELFLMTPEEEREEIRKSIVAIEEITGKRPQGFYAREPSENTSKIIKGFSNFIYDSDSYADDIPYFHKDTGILVVPYTPDANDFHFQNPINRFSNSNEFLQYLKDTFDVLHSESQIQPKMMSAGFHVRVSGRPGRFKALSEFIKYIKKYDDVWITTREEIAKFWIKKFGKEDRS